MTLILHVVISLIGIASGFVVVGGLLNARRLDRWTALFLATTVATSVTGYFLPAAHILPSHIVGAVSLVILAIAIVARYRRHLAGGWRRGYVISAVAALYLNVFVGIVQAFLEVPALKAAAPTQSEAPFVMTQLAALLVFMAVGAVSVIRFRTEPTHAPAAVRVASSGM